MGSEGCDMSVSNTVCVITGSAQGLGKAFAVRLLTAGAKVCLSDLQQQTGGKTLAELRERFGEDKVCFVACNVTVEQDFRNLFDKAEEFFKVSCVDVLVNNAGINTNWGWKKCMEVNIMAVMTGTEIAMERMRKSPKKGQIINVASMAGLGPGLSEDMVGYTVSKTGVIALTRTMAKAVASHGVVTKCSNGSAMAVLKGSPYIIIPDYNQPMIISIVMMAKILEKVLGPDVVTRNHQILCFMFLLLIIGTLLAWII